MPPFAHTGTSTVLESVPAQTKLSLPVMASSRWQQPELSIGHQLPSLDRLGVYKCWALKDKSPAAVVWKAISGPVITLLEDEYEHLDAKNSELRVEMVMIGRKASTAVPTILFCSEAKITRQNAMRLVKKHGILACHPGIHAAESSRLPRRLKGAVDSGRPKLPSGVYLDGDFGTCGIPVVISLDGSSPLIKATIGGIVCLENRLYGLTTGHAFGGTTELDHEPGSDLEFAFYDTDPLADDSDEEDDVLITSKGSVSSDSTSGPDGSEISEPTIPFNLNIQDVTTDTEYSEAHPKDTTSLIKIGPIPSYSMQWSLDWALIELETSELMKVPGLSFPDLPINKVKWNGEWVFPRLLGPGREGEVLICHGSSDCANEGFMSGVPSFSKARGSGIFQELWQVRRQNGNFVEGNSGTWIVDPGTGDLLGQLVSGYNDTQTAYLMPADQIFRTIEQLIGYHVHIATHREREIFLGAVDRGPVDITLHKLEQIDPPQNSLRRVYWEDESPAYSDDESPSRRIMRPVGRKSAQLGSGLESRRSAYSEISSGLSRPSSVFSVQSQGSVMSSISATSSAYPGERLSISDARLLHYPTREIEVGDGGLIPIYRTANNNPTASSVFHARTASSIMPPESPMSSAYSEEIASANDAIAQRIYPDKDTGSRQPQAISPARHKRSGSDTKDVVDVRASIRPRASTLDHFSRMQPRKK